MQIASMATQEERLNAIRAAIDETIATRLQSETYNGHTQAYFTPSELIAVEQHMQKAAAAAAGAGSSGGLTGRRILARFNR